MTVTGPDVGEHEGSIPSLSYPLLHKTDTDWTTRKISAIMISTTWELPFPRLMLVVILSAAASAAAEQVTLARDSPLYAEPRLDAAQVAQLKQGAAGEVTGRQGGWLSLKTPEGAGWLFTFNVRFPPQKPDGEPDGGAVLGRVFGPHRPGTVVSAIGIRGLEEEDLRQATFNAEQLKRLDRFAVTKPAAEEGARTAGLAPEKVDYLRNLPAEGRQIP